MLYKSILLVSMLIPHIANASPLNPWGSRIPNQTIAVNPYLYIYPGPNTSTYGYAGVGFANRFDLYAGMNVNFTAAMSNVGTLGAFELLPRVFVTDYLAFSPHLFWTPGGDFTPAPEIHFAKTFGKFALTINTGWRPTLNTTTQVWNAGSVFAIVAPEFYLHKQFAIYMEFDPYIPINSAENSTVVLAPGIWFALDSAQKHSLSTAIQITVPKQGKPIESISGGIWYSTTIGLTTEQ